MEDQADTQVSVEQAEQGGPAAGTQELHIPKHRLDEVSARLRAAQEEIQMKNQLLQQFSQQMRPQVQQPTGPTPEELGIDPTTFQAVQQLAGSVVHQERQRMNAMVVGLKEELDTVKFISEYGADKRPYLEKIKAEQRKHAQLTQTFLPMDVAYRLIRSDELERAMKARVQPQAEPGQPPVQAQTQGEAASYPSAAATRVPTGGAPLAGTKVETIEEMEARLERDFVTYGSI